MPDTDGSAKWQQNGDGLHISAVRAQRLYNNYKWSNPIVLKITNTEPALVPPSIETVEVSEFYPQDGGAALKGNLKDPGGSEILKVGFLYRPFAGFVQQLYDDTWTETEFITTKNSGEYQIKLKGLKRGKTYQFRAVVKHPLITIYGDIKKFSVR